MKRHPALVPLSEDHHQELVQARRLVRAAERTPEERLAAGAGYVETFFTETVEHFRREEESVLPLYAAHAGANDPLLKRTLEQHMQLHGLVRALRSEVAAGEVIAPTLRELGDLLHEHVRLEERELFEAIQGVVPDEELRSLPWPE